MKGIKCARKIITKTDDWNERKHTKYVLIIDMDIYVFQYLKYEDEVVSRLVCNNKKEQKTSLHFETDNSSY